MQEFISATCLDCLHSLTSLAVLLSLTWAACNYGKCVQLGYILRQVRTVGHYIIFAWLLVS